MYMEDRWDCYTSHSNTWWSLLGEPCSSSPCHHLQVLLKQAAVCDPLLPVWKEEKLTCVQHHSVGFRAQNTALGPENSANEELVEFKCKRGCTFAVWCALLHSSHSCILHSTHMLTDRFVSFLNLQIPQFLSSWLRDTMSSKLETKKLSGNPSTPFFGMYICLLKWAEKQTCVSKTCSSCRKDYHYTQVKVILYTDVFLRKDNSGSYNYS